MCCFYNGCIESTSEIAKDFGISPSTLTMIFKQHLLSLKLLSWKISPQIRKGVRIGDYTEIDDCMSLQVVYKC